jgi:ribulose-phosphate 3-epimerase
MNKYLIAPSILSADFARLGEDVDAVIQAGADMIHFDVMDNHYVPNLTVGPFVCRALKDFGVQAPLDVHLMVEPVDEMIIQFADAGADCITFHPEASRHVDRSLSLIKAQGCEAGLVLNPATPIEYLDYVMHKLDVILMMTVNPGFGGQPFIESSLDKIKQVKSKVMGSDRPIRLQVDGGINALNIKAIADAGADTFVAGSAIFGQANYQQAISALRQALV